MKLIEYKPDLGKVIVVDIKNLPKYFEIKDIEEIITKFKYSKSSIIPLIESKPTVVDMGSTWVHPDYRVPEDKFVVGHDPYGPSEEKGEIKVYKTKSSDSFNGNSVNHLWWPFPDPEGLNEVNPEVWEAAKPKLNEGLMNQLKRKPMIYGTIGGGRRIGRTHFNEMYDLILKLQAGSAKHLPDDYEELYYLAESPMQTADWMRRKQKCPLLTVDDLRWVDQMVDQIFKKHTSPNLSKLKNIEPKFMMQEKFHPAVPFDRYKISW